MSARLGLALAAAIAALAATGCPTSVTTCVPNQSISCSCGDETGFQVCQANGTYSVCSCQPLDASVAGADAGPQLPDAGLTTLAVRLVKPTECGSNIDPMAGVTQLHVRLLNADRCLPNESGGTCEASGYACTIDLDCGFGAMVREKVAAKEPLSLDVPPGATPLAVEVTGYPDAPASGTELAFGRSPRFAAGVTSISVQFRRVETFSPVCSASASASRTALSHPRAGHTATVLADGRVLVAGGFDTTGLAAGSLKDPSFWTYLDSAEIFDPWTGDMDAAVPAMNRLGEPTPRAFHTASLLPGNQVLVTGGEFVVSKTGVRSPYSQQYVVLFDPTLPDGNGRPIGGWAPQPSRITRSRHRAMTDQTGVVLLYGGLSFDGTGTNPPTYVQSYEWFDPALNLVTKLDPASQAPTVTAVGHAGAPLYGGKYLGVVGGSMLDTGNAGKLNKDRGTKFFMYREGRMQEQTYIPLPVPRTFVSIAGQGVRYLIAGGFQDFDPAHWWDLLPGSPYGGTDILNLKGPGSQPQILQGPSLDVPRGHTCSVTLPDGRMLVIGGRGGAGSLGSLAATTLFTDDGNVDPQAAFTLEKGPDLAEGRYFHTCTLLADGSVLVAGGVAENGSDFATLGSLEIFVPRPPAP